MKDFKVKLPNELLYTEGDEEPIIKIVGEKLTLLVLYYIKAYTGFRGVSLISISRLLKECGYSEDKKNINKIKQILNKLKEMKLINFEVNIEEVKKNESLDITTEGLDSLLKNGYFSIWNSTVETIKANIPNKNEQMINVLIVKSLVTIYPSKVAFYDKEIETIISEKTLKKCLKELEELDLITETFKRAIRINNLITKGEGE